MYYKGHVQRCKSRECRQYRIENNGIFSIFSELAVSLKVYIAIYCSIYCYSNKMFNYLCMFDIEGHRINWLAILIYFSCFLFVSFNYFFFGTYLFGIIVKMSADSKYNPEYIFTDIALRENILVLRVFYSHMFTGKYRCFLNPVNMWLSTKYTEKTLYFL